MPQIITIRPICVTHVQKNLQIRASIKQFLTKYQIFTILPKISHFHQIVLFQVYLQLFRPTASSLNFMAGTCQETSFSFLPVVSC